jgi:hypothetical protein
VTSVRKSVCILEAAIDTILVKIVGNNGVEVVFAFRLGRQLDGEFDGMWMTDAVWPVASGDIPEQAF